MALGRSFHDQAAFACKVKSFKDIIDDIRCVNPGLLICVRIPKK